MRPDFARVYNTPARRGRGAEACVNGGRPPRELDDLPRFEGIADARRRGWDRKQRDHHWNALKRWLRAQVGRPWDDVWSEICRVSDPRSGSSRVLREHALRQVETRIRTDADGIVRHPAHGYEIDGLYVDGEGVLRFRRRERRPREGDADHDAYTLDEHRGLRRIGGLWYEILYAELPEPERIERVRADGTTEAVWTSPSAWDVVEKATVYRRAGLRWNRGATRYAHAKRALSRKELRAYGLANQPED